MKRDSEYAIELHNVSVSYRGGVVALRDASMQIPEGVFCAVVGMNGAGKSTLFKTILGLVKPSKGFASIFDEESSHVKKRGLVGYMPQTEQVDWDFPISVYDVVMMGRYPYMGMTREPAASDHTAVHRALEMVGMIDFAKRQIGELSGGQRKRVFLARVLAQDTPILLLDEPFAGVDTKTEKEMTQLLLDLKEKGKTILMSIHELTSLSTYCDYVALVRETVVAAGPLDEVFTKTLVEQTFDGALHHIQFAKQY